MVAEEAAGAANSACTRPSRPRNITPAAAPTARRPPHEVDGGIPQGQQRGQDRHRRRSHRLGHAHDRRLGDQLRVPQHCPAAPHDLRHQPPPSARGPTPRPTTRGAATAARAAGRQEERGIVVVVVCGGIAWELDVRHVGTRDRLRTTGASCGAVRSLRRGASASAARAAAVRAGKWWGGHPAVPVGAREEEQRG